MFNPGAYGTYLEWLLTTLTTDLPILDPFTERGSSHRFRGNHLLNMQGWNNYVSKNESVNGFVRFHPRTLNSELLADNLNSILNCVSHCIYLYPDRNSVLLNINNYFDKIWESWWNYQFENAIDTKKIYDNWPVDPTTPINEIPVWIQREFLSYYLMPAWYDQVEWYHLDTWHHPRCTIVLIDQLLYDIEHTLLRIQQEIGIAWTKPINDVLPIHKKMLSLQRYVDQDQLCKKIIESTTSKSCKPINWSDFELPLASQSYIQWQLRNLGFEIECQNLDTFPTDSVYLKSILYHNHKT